MTTRLKRKRLCLNDLLLRSEDEFFYSKFIDENIGLGVFAKKEFSRGDFLLEYKGELISPDEAKRRTSKYTKEKKGCFVYHGISDVYGKMKCIDATHSNSLGKLVNDSPDSFSNSKMKREVVCGQVHICLYAKHDILKGTEIRYNYGDSEEIMPWRKMEDCLKPMVDDKSINFQIQGSKPSFICLTDDQTFSIQRYKENSIQSIDAAFESDTSDESTVYEFPGPTKDLLPIGYDSHREASITDLVCKFFVKNIFEDDEDSLTDKILSEDEAIEVQPEALEVQPEAIEVQPEALEVQPEALKVQPEALKIQPEALKVQPEPEAIEVQPEAIEVQPEALEVPPEAIEAQPEAFDTPLNDSGVELESALQVEESGDELEEEKRKYTKPKRPCFICGLFQSRLKRHILKMHSTHELVSPILSMNIKEQNKAIESFRKNGIRNHNLDVLKTGKNDFMRERSSSNDDAPVMCVSCKGFFAKSYKARHQARCPANGNNFMVPMVAMEESAEYDNFSDDFKSLLGTLRIDEVGDYLKTDKIILMLGYRSFGALKRKMDKKIETKKTVRSRMRLVARLYLAFRDEYAKQKEITIPDKLNNAADMYRREGITILGNAINKMCEDSTEADEDASNLSITKQKSGLKISILNILKLTSKFLIGYFLMKNEDTRSDRIKDFVTVLKLFEEELFGDAYYDINYRRNVQARKPAELPKDSDVDLINQECVKIMSTADVFDINSSSYVSVRSAVVTYLIIFNARRGGEPVRLLVSNWREALNGEWEDQEDYPDVDDSILVTYQTGKGANHLVPVMFPPECHKAINYLADNTVRANANVAISNKYLFPSTKNSDSHPVGWSCINEILMKLNKVGAINATRNRHRVATLLARLQLSDEERNMIFKHFGHSKEMNENRYQAAPGSIQVNTTGKRLQELNKNLQKSQNPDEESQNINKALRKPEKKSLKTVKEVQNTDNKLPETDKTLEKIEKEVVQAHRYPNNRGSCTIVRKEMTNHLPSDSGRNSSKREYRLRKKRKVPTPKDNSNDGSVDNDERTTWSDNAIANFKETFHEYLRKDKGYPKTAEMEKFGANNGVSGKQVRNRIVNTRRIRKLKQKTLGQQMNIFD